MAPRMSATTGPALLIPPPHLREALEPLDSPLLFPPAELRLGEPAGFFLALALCSNGLALSLNRCRMWETFVMISVSRPDGTSSCFGTCQPSPRSIRFCSVNETRCSPLLVSSWRTRATMAKLKRPSRGPQTSERGRAVSADDPALVAAVIDDRRPDSNDPAVLARWRELRRRRAGLHGALNSATPSVSARVCG